MTLALKVFFFGDCRAVRLADYVRDFRPNSNQDDLSAIILMAFERNIYKSSHDAVANAYSDYLRVLSYGKVAALILFPRQRLPRS